MQNQQPKAVAAKLPCGGHVPPGVVHFQIAWQGTCTARCKAPQKMSKLQTPPGGTSPHRQSHMFQCLLMLQPSPSGTVSSPGASGHSRPSEHYLSPGGSNPATRRHSKTTNVLVFLHFLQLLSFNHVVDRL